MTKDKDVVSFEKLALYFESDASTVDDNRRQIAYERGRVHMLLEHLNRLDRANQAMCEHPRSRQIGHYDQYTDGYTECTICGATW